MQEFENFGLNNNILKAIKDLGFETPTPIQKQTIPQLLGSNQDLIGLAETGTGKTAAFGLPILQQINFQKENTQCIIIAPTRELCLQITKDMSNFAKYIPEMNVTAVYGGASIVEQIKNLRKTTHIVVGTPGRVLDLIKRKVLKIDKINFLVLDEADEMLNMGFKEDIDSILATTPKGKQTLLFSATMPPDIMKIAETYMNSPIEISVGKRNSGAANVEHFYYMVNAKNRYLALKRIADINPDVYGIVFCRTRKETQEVADKLIHDGYDADALHGDLSQAQRDHVMNKFRSQHLQLLVATDVAARGLDVNNLTHIINYNLPDDNEVYIHRSGRTGRAGRKGVSVSIIHSRELKKIKDIEKALKKTITRQQVPSGKDICKKQLLNMIDKVENIETIDNQIEDFLPLIFQKLSWLDREDLIKRFVSVEFNRFLMYYQNAPDLNISEKEAKADNGEGKRGTRDGRRENGERRRGTKDGKQDRGDKRGDRGDGKRGKGNKNFKFTKFFLSLGDKDNFTKSKLLDLINRNDSLAGAEVGKIEILKTHTFFEIDSSLENSVMKTFKNRRYEGKRLKIEVKMKK